MSIDKNGERLTSDVMQMTLEEFRLNTAKALNACDSGVVVFIIRRGKKFYRVEKVEFRGLIS